MQSPALIRPQLGTKSAWNRRCVIPRLAQFGKLAFDPFAAMHERPVPNGVRVSFSCCFARLDSGQQPEGFRKRNAVLPAGTLDLLPMGEHFLKLFGIGFHPFAAQKNQARRGRKDRLPFGIREHFSVEGHSGFEIQ